MLPMPVLDDRGFQELVDGMRERLPRIAPEWTDHNASDPGITLLELFAYQADILSYRFDRIPPRLYRAFLRLLGCEPLREQTAFTPITFTCAPGTARTLAAGLQLRDEHGAPGFQSRTAFHASDASLAAVLTQAEGRWVDRAASNDALRSFAPFGFSPKPGDALYLGFDRALGPAEARVRLWSFGEDLEQDAASWRALLAEWRRHRRARRHCPRGAAWHEHYGVRVVWEYFDGQGWRAAANCRDYTRALTLSGPVRWRVAQDHAPGGVVGHESRYFIRCRLVSGNFDCPPMIRGLRFNTVLTHHAVDIAGVVDPGRSTGAAQQRFRLSQAPVVPASVRATLTTATGAVEEDWRERPDFDRSGPHAKHFVLDARTGFLEFGNGRAGAVPEAGCTLTATWRVGGGRAGNVPAGTLVAASGSPTGLAVSQLVAACGGVDAESLEATKARAFRRIQSERCAATLADLARVALEAPALPVARAFAVGESHPDLSCLDVAGCVSLVIVPTCVDRQRDPTPALCAAVARHLEPRRPLALELHVTGPTYTQVAVRARLALLRNASAPDVRLAARTALAKFLHPLHGGPDGVGWKVGRSVFRSEVLAVLNELPGVHHVAELALTADSGCAASCGDIPLCANGLAASGEHEITFIDGAGR